MLGSVGIAGLHDEKVPGVRVPLTDIDPFSFFCFIYKYRTKKRLELVQEIAAAIGAPVPTDESGIPSAQAQQVCLFTFTYERKPDDIDKLWDLFDAALSGTITDEMFADVLNVKCTGKAKITEGLFTIMPDTYLPINGPVKAYLLGALGLDPSFDSWADYLHLLERIKEKRNIPFYEFSYEAWKWNKDHGDTANAAVEDDVNYWIFQCNTKTYDLPAELRKGAVKDLKVKAHSKSIKQGDKVIMWVVGPNSGCYALAEVTAALRQEVDDADVAPKRAGARAAYFVPLEITHNLADRPLLESHVQAHSELAELKVGLQGTVFRATAGQYNALKDMAESNSGTRYWMYAPGENAMYWEEMFARGEMGIGWNELGDLRLFDSQSSIEAELADARDARRPYNSAKACFDFVTVLKPGDVIICKKGNRSYIGWGIVTSEYIYEPTRDTYHHWRKVLWKAKGMWEEDVHPIVLKTLTDITKYPDYVARLCALLGINQTADKLVSMNKAPAPMHPLNTIFYGPPGTGKTYTTIKRAAEIVAGRTVDDYKEARSIYHEHLHDTIEFLTFHQNYGYEDFVQGLRPDTENTGVLSFHKKDGIFKSIADKARRNEEAARKGASAPEGFEAAFERFMRPLLDDVVNELEVKMVRSSFFVTGVSERSIYFRNSRENSHHSLSISTLRDFYYHEESTRLIQGLGVYYRPLVNALRPNEGAKHSTPEPLRNYVLIIDEINRANISRVFGELITLIEDDKRTQGEHHMKVRLPSGDVFSVPSNLSIIGTMNTADKSIALLDIALRRRFVFEPMYPRTDIPGIRDVDILRKINEQIVKRKNHDFQIGHAYFMGPNYHRVDRMNNKVIPLLLEYFMNDGDTVKEILKGAGLSVKPDVWPLQVGE